MALWLVGIAGFAVIHALHLRADFPNHSPWMFDWAKYTDEGWYGDAAVRAHLLGQWYLAGDFNPAVAVPVWPALEWLLFCVTGVSVEAARGLAVAIFFVNLALSYALLRADGPGLSRFESRGPVCGPRWPALVGISLLVTSPYLFCFSRLAILEPLLTALVLAALNVAVRMGAWRRPAWGAAAVGALAVLAALTKTTAIFLLPAIAWAMIAALWPRRNVALRCAVVAGAVFAGGYVLWLAMVTRAHLLKDFQYYFFVNKYPRPQEWYWPAVSLWWSLHGVLWVDGVVAVLVGGVGVFVLSQVSKSRPGAPGRERATADPSPSVAAATSSQDDRKNFGRGVVGDPVVGASVLGVAGMVLFMTMQNHPQPRYFVPVAFFVVFILVRFLELLSLDTSGNVLPLPRLWSGLAKGWTGRLAMAMATLAVTALAIGMNGAKTLKYAAHPEYTFVTAAENLTHYIDTHPNANRLLVSVSGDEISLITHVPSLCDDFGTMDLPAKLGAYRPGWFASWNDLDPGTLEDLHTRYSVEQVATFPALDDPERHALVLFKLHPLPNGRVRDPHDAGAEDLSQPLPEDRIDVEME
jgi:hypothetical protein